MPLPSTARAYTTNRATALLRTYDATADRTSTSAVADGTLVHWLTTVSTVHAAEPGYDCSAHCTKHGDFTTPSTASSTQCTSNSAAADELHDVTSPMVVQSTVSSRENAWLGGVKSDTNHAVTGVAALPAASTASAVSV